METIIDLPFILVCISFLITLFVFIYYFREKDKEQKLWIKENKQLKADYLELQSVSIQVIKHDAFVIEMSKKLIEENEQLKSDNQILWDEKGKLLQKIDFNLKCHQENELSLKQQLNDK